MVVLVNMNDDLVLLARMFRNRNRDSYTINNIIIIIIIINGETISYPVPHSWGPIGAPRAPWSSWPGRSLRTSRSTSRFLTRLIRGRGRRRGRRMVSWRGRRMVSWRGRRMVSWRLRWYTRSRINNLITNDDQVLPYISGLPWCTTYMGATYTGRLDRLGTTDSRFKGCSP